MRAQGVVVIGAFVFAGLAAIVAACVPSPKTANEIEKGINLVACVAEHEGEPIVQIAGECSAQEGDVVNAVLAQQRIAMRARRTVTPAASGSARSPQ